MADIMEHRANIINAVEHLLCSQEDREAAVAALNGIRVGTWVPDKDKHYHITVSRVNKRNGYEKTVAIPYEQIPTVIAELVDQLAMFGCRVDEMRGK